ncbi:MAG: cation:proton antiporter, partial [Chitinivibrionales bacterium]
MEHTISTLLVLGITIIVSFYTGKGVQWIRLPSIIGFMVVGVISGPSIFNILNEHLQQNLTFITEMALGFVALTIGLELSFVSLKKQGMGIVLIILAESLAAFILVTGAIFLLTRDLPLALIFGAIAPASAPAGTVAVIQELRARGNLTKALYAVVGFDDGLGIVIFGFAAAFAQTILESQAGLHTNGFLQIIAGPLIEVVLSILVGTAAALLFCILGRKLENSRDIFILIVGFIFVTTGLAPVLHISLILTNMVFGMVVINTQPHGFSVRIGEELSNLMPLLFILFFTLAGANLHLSALPSLGFIGIVYVLSRSAGLIGGSRLGGIIGKADPLVKKWLGLGILSQAG